MISYLYWLAVHLSGLGLILLTALCLGDLTLRRVSFGTRLERLLFSVVLGLGLCALLLFGLGIAGWLKEEIIWAMTGLGAAGALFRLGKKVPELRREGEAGKLSLPSRWQAILIAAGIVYWLYLLTPALYPPIEWDAVAYHLVLARHYLEEHQVGPHSGAIWPVLPALNQLLFTWALAIKDDILAQMIEHVFFMLIALGLYAWGRRLHQPLLGLMAATLWLSHPLVIWLASAAYIDVGLSAFVFFGLYALRLAWENEKGHFWILGMALFGMAAGAKIPAVVFPLLGAAFGLIALKWGRLNSRQWMQGLAAGLLVMLPWYLLIWAYTGNPVWPLLTGYSNGIWGHPTIAQSVEYWTRIGIAKTPLNLLLIPVLLIAQPQQFLPDLNLTLMPLMGLFPLCWLVMWKDRSVRWWSLWASAILLVWFLASQQIRLLLPMFPVAGLAISESLLFLLKGVRIAPRPQQLLWSGLAVIFVFWGCRAVSQELSANGPLPTTPLERHEWLSSHSIGYNAARFINSQAGEREKVYVVNAPWLCYQLRPYTVAVESMLEKPYQPSSPPLDHQWSDYFKARDIDWILFTSSESANGLRLKPEVLEPDYQLVYWDPTIWAFRRQPSSPPAVATTNKGARGNATIGIYRPSSSQFVLRNSNTTGMGELGITYGIAGDVPLAGDWDGDGTTTIGVYRPSDSTFHLRNSLTDGNADMVITFGVPGDLPVVGDWDGNGTTTIGVYRPSKALFFLRNSNSLGDPDLTLSFGKPHDVPLAGDWDGDGIVTIGIYRPSEATFYLCNAFGYVNVVVAFGQAGDLPVVGDWDGDGTTTIGIYRPGVATFILRNSNLPEATDSALNYGAAGDLPLGGNWDGE